MITEHGTEFGELTCEGTIYTRSANHEELGKSLHLTRKKSGRGGGESAVELYAIRDKEPRLSLLRDVPD